MNDEFPPVRDTGNPSNAVTPLMTVTVAKDAQGNLATMIQCAASVAGNRDELRIAVLNLIKGAGDFWTNIESGAVKPPLIVPAKPGIVLS